MRTLHSQSSPDSRHSKSSLQPMILIVDDEPRSADLLCKVVSREHYLCKTALSGAEALQAIRSHPHEQPLLVILDEMMPGLSGTDVLQTVRGDPRIAHTDIIMYSAGCDPVKRQKALALGASAWVVKGGGQGLDEILAMIVQWHVKAATNCIPFIKGLTG